jgi:Protein of unknown function (DUF3383)
MADIDQIIAVNISRETSAVTQSGFQVAMFMGDHRRFTERSKRYKSAKEVAADGFLSTDVEYTVALKYFSQELKPKELVIGRRKADDTSTITFEAGTAGKVFSVEINGVEMTYTSAGVETAVAVAAGFETANSANFTTAGIVYSDAAANGTATIAPTVAATPMAIKNESATMSIAHVFSETLVTALNEIDTYDADFYGVMAKSHVKADQLAIAAAVEAMNRIYLTTSSDANIVNQSLVADTTSVAKALKDGAFNRTAVMYSAVANTEYPEAAWLGYGLAYQPGSNTFKFKTLSGITVDALSTTQIANARAKNANFYTNYRNINATAEGVVGSGEFIDIMIFVDFLHARISERLFNLLINVPKLPYTAAGLAAVQAELLAQRQEGIAVGGLSGSKDDVTLVPNIKDVSFADKASRTLNNVSFEWQLAGAIHFINVSGSVVL